MRKLKFLLALIIASASAASIFGQNSGTRKLPDNYVSDNCSWFPDGNYGDCCVEHDQDYFFGGTWHERRASDKRLVACVRSKGHKYISKIMWIGVRLGGMEFLPSTFRWGFGRDWNKRHPIGVAK